MTHFKKFKTVIVLLLLTMTGCGGSLPLSPPVIADPVKLTPLPSSVTKVDSKSSVPYLAKVSAFSRKVDSSLKDEISK
jgi:predicted small lipoprotein YifL